ncbi:hypothetical protein P7C70_g177, partial [Phenoliferia sp. Uapishka_3]
MPSPSQHAGLDFVELLAIQHSARSSPFTTLYRNMRKAFRQAQADVVTKRKFPTVENLASTSFGAPDLGPARFPKATGTELARLLYPEPSTTASSSAEELREDSQSSNGGHDELDMSDWHTANNSDTPPPPMPSRLLYGSQPRLTEYAKKKFDSAERWKDILPFLFTTYLTVKVESHNFKDDVDLYSCFGDSCVVEQVEVKCIDTHGVRMRIFDVCACYSIAIRLMLAGLFPCSPQKTRTAFTMKAVLQHFAHWVAHPTSTDGWTAGMELLHGMMETGVMGEAVSQDKQVGRLLTEVIDNFRSILLLERSVIDILTGDSTLELFANKCPACWGPRKDDVKIEGEPDVKIAFDGNFQHKRLAHASLWDFRNSRPPIFVSEERVKEVEEFVEEKRRTAPRSVAGEAHGCSNWKATQPRKTKSAVRVDATGLLGATCDHDIVFRIIDIVQSGEKYHYAVGIILELLELDPTLELGGLYDIGCFVDAHIDKPQNKLLTPEQRKRLKMGDAIFHAHAHRWACQLLYNPALNLGWGEANGEANERIWALLRSLIPLLRVSTPSHRFESIHFRVDFINAEARTKLAARLLRKLKSAESHLRIAEVELRKIYATRPPISTIPAYSLDYLRAQWKKQREAQIPKAGAAHAQRKATEEKKSLLGRLFARLDDLRQATASSSNNGRQLVDNWIALCSELSQLEEALEVNLNAITGEERGTREDIEHLCRVWETKRVMVAEIQALRLVEQPLKDTRKRSGALGTKMFQKLKKMMKAPREKAKKSVDRYNLAVEGMIKACRGPYPAKITLDEALALPVEDSFWSDGFFTDRREPWASDRLTGQGILWMLRYDRATEEIRRIRNEVRRVLGWIDERETALRTSTASWARLTRNQGANMEVDLSEADHALLTKVKASFPDLAEFSREALLHLIQLESKAFKFRTSHWYKDLDQVWIKTATPNEPIPAALLRLRTDYLTTLGHNSGARQEDHNVSEGGSYGEGASQATGSSISVEEEL